MAAGPIGDPGHPMLIWRWLSLSHAQMAPCDPASSSCHPGDGPALPWENEESVATLAPCHYGCGGQGSSRWGAPCAGTCSLGPRGDWLWVLRREPISPAPSISMFCNS